MTLAVRDLQESFSFYTYLLGLHPVARWYKGAHLVAGETWICLSLDARREAEPSPDYTHAAFGVSQEAFVPIVDRLREAGAISWQENHSPGDSFYFLDPNGHKLEIHVSNLRQRIESLRQNPPKDLVIF